MIQTTMNETPKTISHDCECCILCRGKFSAAKEKIRVFGKSNVDICSLVYRATNVDLSVYVDCEKLAICRTQCYNRIVRFNNALQKVDVISEEIRGYFGGNVSLRVKRMAKDNCNTLEAKKSPDFGSAAATDLHVAETTAEISNHIVASPGIGPRPIQFGAFVPTQIPVKVFIPSNRQNLVQRAFPGFSPRYTSTPLRIAESQNKITFPETDAKETKVRLTVEYPSKSICKELKDDFASLGKAIVAWLLPANCQSGVEK